MTSNQPWWLTMPPAEVAAAILPLFSTPPFSPYVDEIGAMTAIVAWCRTGKPRGSFIGSVIEKQPGRKQFEDPDIRAVAEAVQVLERAGLLMRALHHTLGFSARRDIYSFYVGLTRLGWHALQTNTVRQYLGLGDATPTA